MEYRLYDGGCCLNKKGCCKQTNKLNSYNWLCDIPESELSTHYVEVQFKNTRKGYYLNNHKIPLEKGDVVAVQATPGHDIGMVTMTGPLVLLQMRKKRNHPDSEVLRIYRKAKPTDLEKYEEAKAKEHNTMIQSRKVAEQLGLQMKIGDVEFQGDGNKAIFYYIADDRVDFRQLIKTLAGLFQVRVEMKQIGARQEAGRIGGIGPCGRELCCSCWMSNFISVSTGSARIQDISLNPQKLAGQCAKLKCCLNYEVDVYAEAQKSFPSREIPLETNEGVFYHFKTDFFKNQMTYSSDKNFGANLVTITSERAYEIIGLNKQGLKPDQLAPSENKSKPSKESHDILGESVSRFDHFRKKKKKLIRGNPNNAGNGNKNTPQGKQENKPAENKKHSGNRGGNHSRNGSGNRHHHHNQKPS